MEMVDLSFKIIFLGYRLFVKFLLLNGKIIKAKERIFYFGHEMFGKDSMNWK